MGRIRSVKNQPYSYYILSTQAEMALLVTHLNGLIRLKAYYFTKVCSIMNISYIEPDYTIKPLDPYLAGLVDTDGTVVLNYTGNRIECNLEFKYTEYSSKLCFDYVVPNAKPKVLISKVKNQTPGKLFKTISFRFQTVKSMIPLYEYF
jgi:hypothetical protein